MSVISVRDLLLPSWGIPLFAGVNLNRTPVPPLCQLQGASQSKDGSLTPEDTVI